MSPRRLLLITHSYSPEVSPRALRFSAIAEHWAAEGWRIDVLCGRHEGLPSQECRHGVHVHRVGSQIIGKLRHRFAASSGGVGKSKAPGRQPRALLTHLSKYSWKKIWWPDYAGLWYFTAARAARKLVARYQHDALISISHPFTGHLVGLAVKRVFGRLPWIVDIGDPFSFLTGTPPNNHALYHRLNFAIEKKVFDQADTFSVTNEATRKIYADLFPRSADRMRVIPPLLRTDMESQGAARLFPDTDRLRLAFIGRCYPTIRSPEHLLRTFHRLLQTSLGERLELHFLGPLDGCDEYFKPYRTLIGSKLYLYGSIDYKTARQAMAESDFLVNLGNSNDYQLPSKVIEYAHAAKPVLNFVTSQHDSSAQFFQRYPAVLTLPEAEDENQSLEKLIRFITNPPTIDTGELARWLMPFQPGAIARAYETLIDSSVSHVGQQAGLSPVSEAA